MRDGLEEIAPDPFELENELTIIGSVMADPAALDECGPIKSDDFQDELHAWLWALVSDRVEKGKPVDGITMGSVLKAAPDATIPDVPALIGSLHESAVDLAAVSSYADMIRDGAMRRKLAPILHTAHLKTTGQDYGGEAKAIIEGLEADIAELTGTTHDRRQISAGAAFAKAIHGRTPGLECGLTDLDEMLGGLRPGSVYVIGGRSSMGKSAFGLDQIVRQALKGRASAFFSLEMPDDEVAARIGSSMTGIPYRDIIRGKLFPKERAELEQAAERVRALPLEIFDTPGITVASLRSRIRRWKRDQAKAGKPIGAVAVDYLQLIRAQSNASIYEKTTEISRGLKPMARELGIPLIVLAQLSRGGERETDKRPKIHHLRDSGAIEEDADAIMLVYRDAYYAEREPESSDVEKEQERRERTRSYKLELDVAKNRQGGVGKVELWANVRTNEFRDWR